MGGRLTRAAPLLRASGWDVERGEGQDRYTIYLTPNQHGRATGAHDTHTRSHASDGADPDRERTGEQVGNVEPIGPALWQIYFGPTTLGWFDEELFVIFDTHGNTGRNPIC